MDDPPTEGDEARTRTEESTPEEPIDVPTLLELDEVFSALSHPRRRYLLYTLINGHSEETLPELATKIVAWERDKSTAEVTDEERREVHLSLYHAHVPKLADLGIVEYRQAEDIIVRARNTEQVQAVLDGAGAELDQRQEDHARRTGATGGTDADGPE